MTFVPNGKEGCFLKTGRNQFLYVFFYLIFSPETWRALIGLLATLIISPMVTTGSNYNPLGRTVLWLMILVIFYVLSAPVGKFISRQLTAAFKNQGIGTTKSTKGTKKNR